MRKFSDSEIKSYVEYDPVGVVAINLKVMVNYYFHKLMVIIFL